MYSFGGSALALVALCCLLSVAAATGALAAPSENPTELGATGQLSVTFADDEDNETPRHENPDEYGEDGDLEGMEGWLAEQLSSQLGDSAIELSQGEYDLAREYIGDDYDDRLGQYVDVAGETEGDGQGDSFEETREEQEQLTDDVEEYRETREEYEQARDEGDGERARELARELEALSQRINDSSGTVRENYDEIGSETGADFSEPDRAIEETNTEVQSEQETVRDEQFVETELVLEPESETISFLDPLVAGGEVRTADGSTLANDELEFAIENDTARADTDGQGAFTLEYRPTDLSLETTELTIRYVPDPESVYLGSETTVPIAVEQVEPEITELDAPETAAYGDEMQIAGALAVDGAPVDGVPLEVRVDGERLGTVNASDGTFERSVTMPATVPSGERELTVELPHEDRALASTSETTPVTVEETASSLSIDASYEGDDAVAVEGTLETAAGDGVGDEPVQLSLNGTTIGTVTTGPDGTFAGTVTVSEGVEGEISIGAAYEGAGSNVAPAEAETMASLPTEPGPRSTLPLPAWLLGLGGVAVVAAVGVGLWSIRRRRNRGSEPARQPTVTDSGGGDTAADGPAVADAESAARALLERAGDQLSAGRPDAAVRSGYAAVRRVLESRTDAGGLTHWEFYRRLEALEDDEDGALRTVTEGYERAAFDRAGLTEGEATGVLERARRLCGLEDGDRSGPADD